MERQPVAVHPQGETEQEIIEDLAVLLDEDEPLPSLLYRFADLAYLQGWEDLSLAIERYTRRFVEEDK